MSPGEVLRVAAQVTDKVRLLGHFGVGMVESGTGFVCTIVSQDKNGGVVALAVDGFKKEFRFGEGLPLDIDNPATAGVLLERMTKEKGFFATIDRVLDLLQFEKADTWQRAVALAYLELDP